MGKMDQNPMFASPIVRNKPTTGGPMPRKPVADPKFQMPAQKQAKDKNMFKMQAIQARLGK
jgi:hypothetical protein